MQPFTLQVKSLIQRIPAGRVATYGSIAAQAGNPRAARQVARILHACSRKDRLPWHRVINREGRIALKPGQGHTLQRKLLETEGVFFDPEGRIDLNRYLWVAG